MLINTESEALSFDEFENVVLMPTCPLIEDWASTLPLPKILTICLIRNDTTYDSNDLKEVTDLDEKSISLVVENFAIQLKGILGSCVKQLQEAKAKMRQQRPEEGNALKFVGRFAGGTVSDFHKNLTDRVGWPNLSFDKSMEDEHYEGRPFEGKGTFGTNDSICPRDEYDYVVHPTVKSPPSKGSRIIPAIENLLENPVVKDAQLKRVEVIALVLYTGPMFYAYNDALRISEATQTKSPGRSYSTTIFVLASAVVKLTKVQNISSGMRLYRGLGGDVDLPEFFHKPDARGRKGLTEFGFLSTTKRRDIAIRYSGAERDKPIPIIFEIETGSVDRGADIRDFSQYAHEAEYLWAPGTFLEPIGLPQLEVALDSVVTVYRVRANSNLKVTTIDELLSAKRDMHLHSFDYLITDVRQNLEKMGNDVASRLRGDFSLHYDKEGYPETFAICSKDSLIEKIVQQCNTVKKIQSEAPLSDFALDKQLLKHARAMLETVTMARSKLRGYLEDQSRRICFDFDSPLRTCHRERMSFLWRNLAANGPERIKQARELCVELGLLTQTALDCDGLEEQDKREHARKLQMELGLVEESEGEVDDPIEPRLVAAAAEGRPKRDLLLLIAAGANLNGLDKEGATPIYAAARYGSNDCLQLLLSQRADFNLCNKKDQTPVWVAVQTGQTECLAMLIEARAGVMSPDADGMTPAWVAAQRGRVDMLRVLLGAGAKLDTADNEGDTPALVAAHAGYSRCLEELISLNANIGQANRGGSTPLMMAAQAGHACCVKLLLSAGADVKAQTATGWSAMHGAASQGCEECVRLLHRAGADLGAVFTRTEGKDVTACLEETPEVTAVRTKHPACAALLEQLARADMGLDPECRASTRRRLR